MEHPTDVYDVTFEDGVTKKCYFTPNFEGYPAIVDVETLLGIDQMGTTDLTIDEENKTATSIYSSTDLDVPNITYNYFQNSNLSAWKVWYCLDNDTSRFAWADDRPAIETSFSGQTFVLKRISENDRTSGGVNYYAWCYEEDDDTFYTITETPTIEDKLYTINDEEVEGLSITNYFPSIGRGVIYRLIDEWNNDVAYDFKNIQFARPLTDGGYDADNGTDTWVYTFSYWYNDGVIDSSTEGQTFTDDGGDIAHICENAIKARNIGGKYELSNNVIYSEPDGEWYYGAKFIKIDGDSNINTILGNSNISLNYSNQTIIEGNAMVLYECFATSFSDDATIYIGNKKVLTES